MGGYLVTCEGLDAAGKTTSIKQAIAYLKKEGYDAVYNKGLQTKTIMGEVTKIYLSTLTLLIELLYTDLTFVRPNLKKGKIVIQDRWYASVLSHNPENIKDKLLGKIFVPLLSKPHIYVHYTVSLEERAERLKKRTGHDHRKLAKDLELVKQMEGRYLSKYRKFDGKKSIINTTKLTEEESGKKLCALIEKHLKQKFYENSCGEFIFQ